MESVGAVERRLVSLEEEAASSGTLTEYMDVECRVMAVVQEIVRDSLSWEGVLGRNRDVLSSHLNRQALHLWRERALRRGLRRGVDPYGRLVDELVPYLNGSTEPPAPALFLSPCGCSLGELPAPVLRALSGHPLLRAPWREALRGTRRASSEGYDPVRGGFVPWMRRQFRWKIKEHAADEAHVVRRSMKTESRRRRGGTEEGEAWGYLRLDAAPGWDVRDARADREQRRAEDRREAESLLGRLREADRRFVAPLMGPSLESQRDLARYWGVTPSSVTLRLQRIRRRVLGSFSAA